jgi:glycogenin glucosyltransferase
MIKPSLELFERLKEASTHLKSYDGGDTGFLNAFYPNWYTDDSTARLPFAYNAQRTMFYFTRKNPGYWQQIQPVKVSGKQIHFLLLLMIRVLLQ